MSKLAFVLLDEADWIRHSEIVVDRLRPLKYVLRTRVAVSAKCLQVLEVAKRARA